jgi:hypothetical protein
VYFAARERNEELSRLVNAVEGMTDFKKDLKKLETKINLISAGITQTKILSPTSDFLGQRVVQLITKNATDILMPSVGNSNKRINLKRLSGLCSR